MNEPQLPVLEREKIDSSIRNDLVEHLYKGIPVGTISGFFATILIFLIVYNEKIQLLLISWLISFDLIMLFLVVLFLFYKKYKHKFNVLGWEVAIYLPLIISTMYYGTSIFFSPDNIQHQLLLTMVLFMVAFCFAMSTVGTFKLSLINTVCVLLPVSIWFFLQQDSFYWNVGGFVLIYIFFLVGMSYKSSSWLEHSLRLKIENASSTYQATHDLVTDLPNQRMLALYIEEIITKVKITGENFALVSFGINRLEMFNNSLGYLASDLIINSISKRLEAQLLELNQLDTKERIVTRPRSDAFVILITPIMPADIHKEVNQLFLTLNKPFHLENRESRLTGSAGVTIFPQDSNDAEKLLTNTYAAMFEAKAKGGNQIAFYKAAMTSNTPHLLEIENDLNNAILRKEFLVYYQPLVDLQSRTICGVEALIRWNHPERGFISPIDFIPVAEETGLILPIGEWVLNEALLQTKAWHQQGFNGLKIAVNLAAKQLRQGNLIETIDNALKRSGINPNCIELELTETALLDESLSPLIGQISKRGISLSIDDFGTGYSGLSYLKHFHIDKIKIDKSFIDDVTSNNDSAAIVTATLAMAKELGIKTLAEGVETQEQLVFLQERGCQYIQGYYFSKPLDAKTLAALLKTGIAAKF